MTDRRILRLLGLAVALLMPMSVLAVPMTTSNYRLDPEVDGAFGGTGSSANYKIVDNGGEAAVGSGSSGSYKLGAGYTANLEQAIQVAVLPSGITSYYPLDTGLGVQAYDSGAGSHTGVLQNSPSWVAGKISQGLSFNGTSQYVSTSYQQNNPTVFTLELWFKTSTSQGGQLIGFGDAATGASTNLDRHIYMTNAGSLVFGVKPSGQVTVTSATGLNNGNWHHVAATLGTGGMQLYVDGALAGTDANTSAANINGYWRLAYDNLTGWPSAPTSNYFNGSLDEVKIYSRKLTATEIANEYAAGQAGLVSAQTIPDVSAGVSQNSLTDVVVRTDAGGYNLAINQDHDLQHTDGVTTIPGIAAAIGAAMLWSEGTTKGLGFTLTNGSQLESDWGTNPNYKYAAVPGSATTFHSRKGFLSGNPETNTLQFRLDVPTNKKAGAYSNTVTISATVVP